MVYRKGKTGKYGDEIREKWKEKKRVYVRETNFSFPHRIPSQVILQLPFPHPLFLSSSSSPPVVRCSLQELRYSSQPVSVCTLIANTRTRTPVYRCLSVPVRKTFPVCLLSFDLAALGHYMFESPRKFIILLCILGLPSYLTASCFKILQILWVCFLIIWLTFDFVVFLGISY